MSIHKLKIIDYRIYDPDGDGKTKLSCSGHALELCLSKTARLLGCDGYLVCHQRNAASEKSSTKFTTVLKDNRQVDDSDGSKPYQRVDSLMWSEAEKQQGKTIKIKGFPAEHKVKVFRVVLSTKRTDYIVTNEIQQDNVKSYKTCVASAGKSSNFTARPSS
jgi:hypothetical protein